jgi:hypothetical protein
MIYTRKKGSNILKGGKEMSVHEQRDIMSKVYNKYTIVIAIGCWFGGYHFAAKRKTQSIVFSFFLSCENLSKNKTP